jgi:tetratricopeptide (TPR) repeat protein
MERSSQATRLMQDGAEPTAAGALDTHPLVADGALDRALELYGAAADSAVEPATRAEALTRLADVHRIQCDWERALSAARAAQKLASSAGLHLRHTEAVIAEANVWMCRGDFGSATTLFEAIAASDADTRLRGIALQNIGSMHAQSGRLAEAERSFSESLGSFRAAGYSRGEAIALNNLGGLALDAKDCTGARPLLERALGLAREVEDSELAACASLNLAWALCSDGDLDRAQDLAMAALGYFADCSNRWREIECLRLIGEINERCEDHGNAARCYQLALSLAEQIGSEPEIRATKQRLESLPAH